MFYKINVHRKTPVLKSHFNRFAGLDTCHFLKERRRNRCFMFLRTPFSTNICERVLLKRLIVCGEFDSAHSNVWTHHCGHCVRWKFFVILKIFIKFNLVSRKMFWLSSNFRLYKHLGYLDLVNIYELKIRL